jgi:hypothetical protein|tara:strand:+ start:1593 stop:2231 length:639 start_codon:yes stop_codon:yes gene_type:complete
MSIKKIQQALYNADLVLYEQVQGPGGSGPWDPFAIDPDMSHAPWFPWWLLPDAGDSDQLQTVWETLISTFPSLDKILWMAVVAQNPEADCSTCDPPHTNGTDTIIQTMQAMIRFISNPHLPSRKFNEPWQLMLRQWMMENLNFIQEILSQFGDWFLPMAPGYESDPETHGGLDFSPWGPSKPQGDIDTGDTGTDSILNWFRIIDKFTPGSIL